MPGWSVRDRLAGIRVPTLVIAGASDFVFPPEAQVELSSGIPGARLQLIERAGHDPWVERRQETLEALRAFLRVNGAAEESVPLAQRDVPDIME